VQAGVREGDLLWTPGEALVKGSNIARFIRWLQDTRQLPVTDYDSLWRWSVTDVAGFWQALWEYFDIQSPTPWSSVLSHPQMPGARWFEGSSVNFAQHLLRHATPGRVALHAYSEIEPPRKVSWEELSGQVITLAGWMRNRGIRPGDRVACYMPNIPEAVVALIASASIGAVFSSCSPDFGYRSVIDRFGQIEPKLLFCVDGYRFGGKDFDRRGEVAQIVDALPSLQTVVGLSYLHRDRDFGAAPVISWQAAMAEASADSTGADVAFEPVPFEHPLWVVYSSGTTGLPKPIVHSHGGITLEFLKLLAFHMNLGPESAMFFFSTTGWVMWNIVIGALLTGSAAVLFDGNPAAPDPTMLWKLAGDSRTTFFGASPTFIAMMDKLGIEPGKSFDLSAMEGILLGGSPATPEAMKWCYDHIKRDLWVTSQSGGTDICSGFVGASPTLPVYAGEIQARCLGVDARAFDDEGNSVIGEVGELVVCQPMPSMPIYFWNDPENRRYLASYFEEFPGLWRHGDYFLVNERGGCFIYGRSDSTLNRYGVRIGTAEIYRTVEQLEEIEDSLIVNLDLPGGRFFMPLFVKLAPQVELDESLQQKICARLRSEYSPRHVPDKILAVADIPYTLTQKKMEIPVRKILAGTAVEKAANRDAMANPRALDDFVRYAETTTDFDRRQP
jgi:acetoacetyl-CoA synthetase